jgi:molybdenum cofactor synthesis domain-containing protein
MPTAAAVIIGDEILSGKFADENGPYLISRLRTLGCDLERLVVIGDQIDGIAAEVRACSDAHDVVFTTGGVGPTHDDRTLEGLAQAFDLQLEQRAELVALIDRFGLPRNEASLRMATLPVGAELVSTEGSSYPVVVVRNVYVFPGVPRLMRMKFEAVAHRFAGEAVRTARLYTDQRETTIAADLGAVQEAWPQVDIGSYPRFGEADFQVIVTLESRDDEALAAAVQALTERLSLVTPRS